MEPRRVAGRAQAAPAHRHHGSRTWTAGTSDGRRGRVLGFCGSAFSGGVAAACGWAGRRLTG
jgi:hypothetical protein